MKTRLSTMILVASLAWVSMSAQAASEWTWVLNSTPIDNPVVPGADLPGAATVMGYSATSNTTELVATSGGGLPDMTWYDGGYGICSTGDTCYSAPTHAMDNNGYKESIVLTFDKSVTLNALNVGWSAAGYPYYQDSDISILAYTGVGAPVFDATTNYANLVTSKGWTLISQLANVAVSTNVTSPSVTFSTAISSSYWMIAAYNSAFGGTKLSDDNDYVKVYAVAGNTTNPPSKVSEPGALMLVGAAMLGVVGLRRRRQTEQ